MQEAKSAMQEKAGTWPRVVKRGGAAVKIYRISNRGRAAYQVAYWIAGARVLKNFAAYNDAHTHADEQAVLLNSGRLGVAKMHDHDREAFVAAARILKPLDVPLLDAVKSYAAAVAELKGTGSLVDAARDYATRHATALQKITVAELVAEFLAAKDEDKKSYRYLKTLRSQLAPSPAEGKGRNSFADSFRTDIASITSREIDLWLRRRGVSPRTRKNLLFSIRTLFNFAKSRGYLPKNQPTEADAVSTPKNSRDAEIGILTPEQLAKLFVGSEKHPANDEYRLWFALGAFTGLRTEELKRLEWADISAGHVTVKAGNAKTGSRRIVPIADNLRAWLATFAQGSGKVFPRDRAEERAHAYAERLGIAWPHNGLRHSFITYRVAAVQDVARVALEAGNSPQIIFKHYRELATEAQGKTWFSIVPAQPANVVSMRRAAR